MVGKNLELILLIYWKYGWGIKATIPRKSSYTRLKLSLYFCFRHRAFKALPFRQRGYLDYIYMKNRPLYKEIIEKLREKFHEKVKDCNITQATEPLISDKALDDLDVPNGLGHRLSDCSECWTIMVDWAAFRLVCKDNIISLGTTVSS